MKLSMREKIISQTLKGNSNPTGSLQQTIKDNDDKLGLNPDPVPVKIFSFTDAFEKASSM